MAEEAQSHIVTVRTTAGRERQVIDKIMSVVKKGEVNIYSIISPQEIKGYFFVEAESIDDVRTAVYGIQHVKGVIEGEVSLKEIEHFFAPLSSSIKVEERDIVELTSGPFKGEKARVQRVNKLKEELVVELLEAAVPIPLTVKLDSIRVLGKEEDLEEQ
ncbi:Transcription elongation factor Spt5 [Candidatus Tiddalikarchaeum anstoanum]|nr:Transcription elongation factor Spt5 [Candidatus Tiddalikarchaeum anstoanum]